MAEKTRMIGWRMPENMYKRIIREASEDNRSFSKMLEILVTEGLRARYTGQKVENG